MLTAAVDNRDHLQMTTSDRREIASRIRDRLKAVGLSERAASLQIGKHKGYLNEVFSGRKVKSVDPVTLEHLAGALRCDVEYLEGTQAIPRRIGADAEIVVPLFKEGIPLHTPSWPDAEGFFDLGDAVERLVIPAEAIGGFAVMVPDQNNSPRYRAGEIVIASPRRPIAPDAFVVVQLKGRGGRAAIREVVSVAADKVELKAVTQESGERYARDDIDFIYRITACREP